AGATAATARAASPYMICHRVAEPCGSGKNDLPNQSRAYATPQPTAQEIRMRPTRRNPSGPRKMCSPQLFVAGNTAGTEGVGRALSSDDNGRVGTGSLMTKFMNLASPW